MTEEKTTSSSEVQQYRRPAVPASLFPVTFLGECMSACREVIRHPGKIRWKDFWYYLDLCGVKSLPIAIEICFLMGVILGFQAAILMRKFGAELYVADLVCYAIVKELGPLMVAMVCTGRAGSAFAAEIGTMQVNEEVSALTTLGIPRCRFLVMPKLCALFLAMPVLTLFGDIAGVIGGLCISNVYSGIPPAVYLDRSANVVDIPTFLLGTSKSFTFAILICYIGCLKGMQASSDAQGVGRAATDAVVTSIFWAVIADAILTVLFSFVGC